MWSKAMHSGTRWLRRAVNQPLEELNRWQRAARFAYDLGRHGARQLREDRASQMAAALAFHTLFGLAPVLIVATILVKVAGGVEAILGPLHELLLAAGLDQVQIVSSADPTSAGPGATLTLAQWLEDLTGHLANMNLAAIGWVGLAAIVYAAIGLMGTIENSFNIIYRAPGGRPWTRRVPLYWFLLTFSPVLVVTASYVNGRIGGWINSVDAWQWLLQVAQLAWSVGVLWLFVLAVYLLVPNSSVELRPALIGSLVAAVLLKVGANTLWASLGGAFSVNQLFGSLGLVPLFMLWVYVMWLIVLFGLQVSATLQMLQGRTLEEMERKHAHRGMTEPASVIAVMEVVAEHFRQGKPATLRQLADATGMPETLVGRVCERLIEERRLYRVEGPKHAVTLASPPEQLNVGELLEIGFDMVDEGGRRRSYLSEQLRDAQRDLVAETTLRETS